jgi:indolepyruvate ferredoxin oxidoreductase
LIDEYRSVLDRLALALTTDNVNDAARIAAHVMDIRGFGPVKDEAVVRVRDNIAKGLQAL